MDETSFWILFYHATRKNFSQMSSYGGWRNKKTKLPETKFKLFKVEQKSRSITLDREIYF
jgi:hypothetical protein